MIRIIEHADGCILPVHAQAGARKAGILGEYAGALKVAVTTPPADGRANKALAELLAKALELKRSQVKLLSGATNREKRFLIEGIDKKKLDSYVTAIVEGLMHRDSA
jgi:uncharacterized protein (TIGR00251 family)